MAVPQPLGSRVSGRPDDLNRAAALRRDTLEQVARAAAAVRDTGAGAAACCEGLVVDAALPGRILAVVRLAWELDQGIDLAAEALRSADRARALDRIDARRRPALPAGLAAEVRSRGAAVLRFDARGDGRFVAAWGEVTDADHVALLVPGMSNDLTDVPGLMRRADHLLAEMRRRARPGARLAVVVWLGYDTPDVSPGGLLGGAGGGAARAAADDLVRDVARVRRLVPPGSHVTVIGHSYGTRVVAESMRLPVVGLDVPDVVLAGSPGTGVDHRRDLGHPDTRVWEVGTADDWVRRIPVVHGRDPHDERFGGHRLPAEGMHGHSGYFEPGSPSLMAMAAVATGTHRAQRPRPPGPSRRPGPGDRAERPG